MEKVVDLNIGFSQKVVSRSCSVLVICQLAATLSSADNLRKQFGPRSGPTNVGPDLDPNRLTP